MVQSSSPMVVVANRLPFIVKKDENGVLVRKQCAGGLVTAVAPVVVETRGLWVGWPGLHKEDNLEYIPESSPDDKSPTAGLKSEQVIPVMLPRQLFDDYYNGCCNACFWPLFHSMPDRALFQSDKWQAYLTANKEFAARAVDAVKKIHAEQPDAVPLVWIHDYQLMCAANFIRNGCEAEGIQVKLAFFLHIPFPSWDMMRLFPWDDELLQNILGADSIGFHLEDYCFNFLDCCQRRLGCRTDRQKMLIKHNARLVTVHPLPISIPYERFQSLAQVAPAVVKNNPEEQILLGVDRLDYTKGLVHRIKAFERFLEKHPEQIEKVVFIQVAVPSRTDVKEYQELKEELDMEIGKLNGRFSTANWSPIRYIYGCISQEQLAAFYRDSSVALVAPLRDGMNLVAKEFVACQTKEPGVLVLSPFAGAGSSMAEALQVNPYETELYADTINRAITMPKEERELRMSLLKKREREKDVNYWLESFLESVNCDCKNTSGRLSPLREDDFSTFLENYVTESSRLALLLDYDGTLAPIAPHPDLAVIPPETKKVLMRLANMPDVKIAIISGRSLENVKQMVGIEGLTYAGNHGLKIKHPDGTMFVHPVPHEYEEKLAKLREMLKPVCTDGAWLEEKGTGVTFHYREVPNALEAEIISKAEECFDTAGIEAYHSHRALEARPPVPWNKGRAAIYILRTLFGVDWLSRISVIFAGDDRTDEDAMKALQGMAISFRVTASKNVKTVANHRLPSTDAVFTMLKWIEQRLGARSLEESKTLGRTNSVSKSPAGSPTRKSSRNGQAVEEMVTSMTMSDDDFNQMITVKSVVNGASLTA
ncbi:alpha,alpha-trehalose-phosphate synthase [UDP-forming] [Hyalella azteca]|uniref:Alpha,alpha-trehalose-phosphate synthase [UDP-forming] n=1 Tax=Hyalella azteca TaxID=294128 RepID=A0A8B7N2J1_HYAAZ|nr:alpha,alpha-trehalose-phosphate synthase [UDP-forming] [Hyalella azteca]